MVGEREVLSEHSHFVGGGRFLLGGRRGTTINYNENPLETSTSKSPSGEGSRFVKRVGLGRRKSELGEHFELKT